MGAAQFFHDDALEYRETVVCSDRDRRHIDQLIAQNETRLANIMSEQYSQTEQRLTSELDSVMRICQTGDDTVDSIVEDLRNGDITAAEAAAQLGAARRDLNKLRKVAHGAADAEERAWSEVNVAPGEFQRGIAKRFPALFSGGRNLLTLPTFDD